MAGVPNNVLVPFVGVDFDASKAAGPTTLPFTGLIFGQKITAGTMDVNTQYLVSSADEVGVLAGYGSQLHRAAMKWFVNNRVTTVYIIAIADAGGAVAATTTSTITGTATEVGEYVIYIDGDRYAAPVNVGDLAADSAALLVTEINGDARAPVVASFATDTLTLTAKTVGLAAGDNFAIYNYQRGEQFPAGLIVGDLTYTAGSGDPDVQDALDSIGDTWFNILTAPYSDSTNLNAIEDYLANNASVLVQRDGVYYTGKKDTRANLITFSQDSQRNSQYVVVVACTNQPHSVTDVVSGVAARTAESAQDDTAVPLHRMTITGLLPVLETERWTLIERNQLVQNGIATLTQDNGVQTEGTVTMYLRNSAAAADTAYQYQNTIFILMRLRYTFRNWILTRYARAKLMNNADRVRSGQLVITPATGEEEAVSWFMVEERAGQVENLAQFKKEVVCQRPDDNVNRLNWLLPTDLVNQFIVGSAVLQFTLDDGGNA